MYRIPTLRFLIGEQPTLAFSNSSSHQAVVFFLLAGCSRSNGRRAAEHLTTCARLVISLQVSVTNFLRTKIWSSISLPTWALSKTSKNFHCTNLDSLLQRDSHVYRGFLSKRGCIRQAPKVFCNATSVLHSDISDEDPIAHPCWLCVEALILQQLLRLCLRSCLTQREINKVGAKLTKLSKIHRRLSFSWILN